MSSERNPSRRKFVRRLVLGAALTPLALTRVTVSRGANQPLLSPDDPAAAKVKYTEDAAQEKSANGHKCSNCGLYEGTYSAAQGPCQIFPDKLVKAAGWCSAWAPQL
jgi:High potential iron-sulfur protein